MRSPIHPCIHPVSYQSNPFKFRHAFNNCLLSNNRPISQRLYSTDQEGSHQWLQRLTNRYWWLQCKEQNFLFYHVTAYYRLRGRNTFLHQDEFQAPENRLGCSSSCLLLPLILAERPARRRLSRIWPTRLHRLDRQSLLIYRTLERKFDYPHTPAKTCLQ